MALDQGIVAEKCRHPGDSEATRATIIDRLLVTAPHATTAMARTVARRMMAVAGPMGMLLDRGGAQIHGDVGKEV